MNVHTSRSFAEKTVDYLLYVGTFSGISLVAGGVVHLLNNSIYNYVLMLIGAILTPLCITLREKHSNNDVLQEGFWHNFLISFIVSFSAGCFTGGLNHIQEHTDFSIYLIISGLIMAYATTLLYRTKTYIATSIDFFLWLSIFSGMSLVSGSIVHAANSWFSNYFMIAVGTLLTPLAIVIRDRYVFNKKVMFGKEFFLLTILSFGVACITGGIIHIEINTSYSIGLILIGFLLSFTAAMFKKDGNLADLRNRHITVDKGE